MTRVKITAGVIRGHQSGRLSVVEIKDSITTHEGTDGETMGTEKLRDQQGHHPAESRRVNGSEALVPLASD